MFGNLRCFACLNISPLILIPVQFSLVQPQNYIAVYLTFDDGPEPGTTQVLDSLKKYGVRVTFFINSDNFAVRDLQVMIRW